MQYRVDVTLSGYVEVEADSKEVARAMVEVGLWVY